MKNRIIMTVLSFFILISTLTVLIALNITPLTLKRETFVYEYGSEISTKVIDYINANDAVIKQATLNFSQVKNEIGLYPASVSYAGVEYKFYIKIEDTTKPVVTLKQVVFNIHLNETIVAMECLDTIKDNSDIVAYFIDDQDNKETEKSFNEKGSYVLNILVEDTAGNQAAKLRLKVVVGNQGSYPTLTGIDNIQILVGEDFDVKEDVKATDGNGNDITKNIKILKNSVNTNKAGTYEVIYSITNNSGNTIQRTRKIEVIKNESENVDDNN